MKRVFVYGSLMNPYEMAWEFGVDPSEIRARYKVKVAVLKGYRRVFNKRSLKWRAALNLKYTGNPEDEVWGILLEVDEQEFRKIEGREKNYRPMRVKVFVHGRPVDAITFISSELTSRNAVPDERYVRIVLEGAEYWSIEDKVLRNLYLANDRLLIP